MANQHFHITISGDNYLFSKQITFEDLKKINYLLLENTASIQTSQSQTLNTSEFEEETSRKIFTTHNDLAMVLKNSNAKRTPDKIAVFAHYLRNYLDQSFFEKKDLVICFEQAQEVVPKNLNRDILWTKKNGWIAEKSDQSGGYYLTQQGQEVIEAKFPKNLLKKTTIASIS